MAEIINLRTARKARVRADASAKADANRHRFGQTKQEKRAVRDEALRREALLDGAKRERSETATEDLDPTPGG